MVVQCSLKHGGGSSQNITVIPTLLLTHFYMLCYHTLNPSGNWSPSDFPHGSTFIPYHRSNSSVNRDLLVVMEGSDIMDAFQTVFENDWTSGTEWVPKSMKRYMTL